MFNMVIEFALRIVNTFYITNIYFSQTFSFILGCGIFLIFEFYNNSDQKVKKNVFEMYLIYLIYFR